MEHAPAKNLRLPGAVALMWSLVGGMLMGGVGTFVMMALGKLSGHMLIASTTAFYLLGSVVGFAGGTLLGVFGRPDNTTKLDAGKSILHSFIYLVPANLVGWMIAGWTAAMYLAYHVGNVIGMAISGVAWIATLLVLFTTLGATHEAVTNLKRYWVEYRDIILNGLSGERRDYKTWVAASLTAVATGLLVLPFHVASTYIPLSHDTYGILPGMGLEIVNGVVDEIFLRMIVMTAAFVALTKYFKVDSLVAMISALSLSVIVDTTIHWSSIVSLGVPSLTMLMALTMAKIVIPSALFGYLYYRRGLMPTLTSHSLAGVVLSII